MSPARLALATEPTPTRAGLSILLDGDPQISYLILLVLTRLVPIYIILLSRLSQVRSVERVEGNRPLLLRAHSNWARHLPSWSLHAASYATFG